jgi:hypothetical protein
VQAEALAEGVVAEGVVAAGVVAAGVVPVDPLGAVDAGVEDVCVVAGVVVGVVFARVAGLDELGDEPPQALNATAQADISATQILMSRCSGAS